MGTAQAGALRYCSPEEKLSAAGQDRALRFAAILKTELERSGLQLALIARSGLDLGYFGVRYSHAGVALRRADGSSWDVRQLYYACDEEQPRIFDQGLSGFVLGQDAPEPAYVSLLLVPVDAAAPLEQAARDKQTALKLLGPRYSANAHAFSTLYQNCNQWLAELLAVAWGGFSPAADPSDLREQAQSWLQSKNYMPSVFELGWRPLLWLEAFTPLLHSDDHPQEDLARLALRVSMPASIEAFVRATVPGAQRIELCRTPGRVVLHRGWRPIAAGCEAGEGDEVIAFD